MSDFNIGDVVYLKSGGERMTVEEVDGSIIECIWFDKNKEIARAAFEAKMLTKNNPKPRPRANFF